MRSRRFVLIALLGSLAGCENPAGPWSTELQREQAVWTGHHLDRYAYQYETMGFFNAFDGHAIRLVVLNDTVRSAQYAGTADSVPVVPATLPTIDALFRLAMNAGDEGRLVTVQFDAVFGYPTRLELSGPPDASGVILASHIELLP